MKKSFLLLAVIGLLTSCDWFVLENKSSDSISGSTDIPINTVGNSFNTSVKIGNSPFVANASVTVNRLEGGVAIISVNASLPANPQIVSLIPSQYKDANGKLNGEVKVKMTDKGILDFTNKDDAPFVLIKYDAKVGDKYVLEKSDGTKITREVVRKSETDDYYWGGMIIKTIDVEQDSRISGIEKIVYFTNHKFGLVGVRVYMEDGTTSQVDVSPSQY